MKIDRFENFIDPIFPRYFSPFTFVSHKIYHKYWKINAYSHFKFDWNSSIAFSKNFTNNSCFDISLLNTFHHSKILRFFFHYFLKNLYRSFFFFFFYIKLKRKQDWNTESSLTVSFLKISTRPCFRPSRKVVDSLESRTCCSKDCSFRVQLPFQMNDTLPLLIETLARSIR